MHNSKEYQEVPACIWISISQTGNYQVNLPHGRKREGASFICKMDASLNIQPKLIASVDTVNTGLLTHRCLVQHFCRWCTGLNVFNPAVLKEVAWSPSIKARLASETQRSMLFLFSREEKAHQDFACVGGKNTNALAIRKLGLTSES